MKKLNLVKYAGMLACTMLILNASIASAVQSCMIFDKKHATHRVIKASAHGGKVKVYKNRVPNGSECGKPGYPRCIGFTVKNGKRYNTRGSIEEAGLGTYKDKLYIRCHYNNALTSPSFIITFQCPTVSGVGKEKVRQIWRKKDNMGGTGTYTCQTPKLGK